MYKLELDDKERQALVELFQVAVKTKGLEDNTDVVVRHFINKITKVEEKKEEAKTPEAK